MIVLQAFYRSLSVYSTHLYTLTHTRTLNTIRPILFSNCTLYIDTITHKRMRHPVLYYITIIIIHLGPLIYSYV